jgi:hypothetical protein
VISAAHHDTVEAFNIYTKDGQSHDLHINYGQNMTVVLLVKYEADAETQQRNGRLDADEAQSK